MTATIIAKPMPINFKLIRVRRLHESDRSEELRDLAGKTEIPAEEDTDDWVPDYRTECTLRTLLHSSLFEGGDATAWAAFREYRNSLLIATGIETGDIPWQDYAPYTCTYGDRKEQAWWDAVSEADGWMRVLLGGHGAARHIHTTQKAGA